ncbi:MAG: type II toxin-antitoxin system Phd/YefM family antitoxin [Symploca sp. SIO1B1]|nr:type II toxin-antitoxin system Phd/YefM family antitoxin [Symploca sp. SIO1B1]
MVLTVNGKAALIMQDAVSYQELLDELALARSAAMIRQGIAEAAEGKDRDAVEALEELRLKHDIPR